MTQARNLHLYGPMAERYGPTHRVCARTIGEAVRIVDCNHRGFAMEMRRKRFHVAVGEGRVLFDAETGSVERGKSKAVEVLAHQITVPRQSGDWHLVPVFTGAKHGGFKTIFDVVIGGALLATGVGGALGASTLAGAGSLAPINLGLGAGLTASSSVLGLSYGTITLMGASMFLGGIHQLLSPTPRTSTASDKPTSFTFSGPGEIDDEGGPIPIICGEVITSGVRIASGIESSSSATVAQMEQASLGSVGSFGSTIVQLTLDG